MNDRPDIRMDKAQFLLWVQGQEGKYELRRGQVVTHPGVSRNHSLIMTEFIFALRNRLPPDQWNVVATDFAIEIGGDIRYPDVLVEKAGGSGAALSTTEPALLIEILSPSSAGTDFTEKLTEYTSLVSLEAYIVASQDEPICWLWQRGPDGAFPRLPEEIKCRDAVLTLAARAITLPLADIYRGIGTV